MKGSTEDNNKTIEDTNNLNEINSDSDKEKCSSSSSSSSSKSLSPTKKNENDSDDDSENDSDSDSDNQITNGINENDKDIKKKDILVEDKSLPIEQLKSLNENGIFLMNLNNKNNVQAKDRIKNIIKNFTQSEPIINKYINDFSQKEKEEFFKEDGFILTKKSKERLALLIHYILSGNPVLFEGNTGTSKTRTTIVASHYIKRFINNEYEFVRFNLSAETRIDDLISKYVGDPKSLIGLKVEDSQFLDAYIKGKILLLDEINLAPPKVLQCIQQSLDNGFISVETSGRGLIKYKKHENFALIATQNPNKGAYIGKRQELTLEFLSRFQKIYCEEIEINEMKEIAMGIAKNLEYIHEDEKGLNENQKQLINDIVELHYEWSKENESENDIQCFTIREIETVIEALKDNNNIYDILMTVYGGRYKKNKKEMLKLKFKKFKSLSDIKPSLNELPNGFSECFKNNELIETVKSVLLSLNNKRNVLIVGKNESGLTQLAEWCSLCFNDSKQVLDNKKKKKKKKYLCYCTKNLERNDLIGSQKLVSSKDKEYTTELLKFKKGILYKAIEKGFSIVLDCINEAPSRVIERLNDLLDKKNNESEKILEIPENTKEPFIRINDNFRIICTSNYEKINQMSPAFINRFDVIVLEDQLTGLTDNDFKELIKFEFNYFQNELYKNIKYKNEVDEHNKKKKEKNKKNKEEKNNNIIDNPFKDIIENNQNQKAFKNISKNKFYEDNELIDLVYEKIKILKGCKDPFDDSEGGEYDEMCKKYLSFSSLAKLCRTIIIYLNRFSKQNINKSNIVNFSFELLFENEISEENDEINELLINELISANQNVNYQKLRNEEKYFFENSKSLKKLMIFLYASSLVNQHLCIIGPPGIGKTLGSRAFSLIREILTGRIYESPFYMHTFNEYTRPSDYFGVSSIKDEKLIFKEGTLTKALVQGNVFIADEFNISSDDCMKSIVPSLELNYSKKLIIPGIEGKIKIDPDFFFIICQNTKDTFGRKELPEKIKFKIKTIYYPERIKEEIENICVSMFNDFHFEKIMSENDAILCGDLLMKINENPILTPWSLRDISKLFERMLKQEKNLDKYINIGLKENILFYIISSINESLIKEQLPIIIDIMKEIFCLNEEETNELYEIYNTLPVLVLREDIKIYIKKNKCEVYLGEKDDELIEKIDKLSSLLDGLFKILISSEDEPILISGPTSFKTFLAELLFNNSKYETISLNSESSLAQFIGSTILLSKEESKRYYLSRIYELLQVNNIENLLLDLDNFQENKEKIKNNIENFTKERKDKSDFEFDYALEQFKKKLFKNNKDKNSLFDMILEFKPGIFISSRIRGYNLILKNISNVKTEHLERLNEVLTGNKKITLNEDTQNSFTPENNKEISFNKNFRVICTCREGEEAKLSESFKSRFTLVYVEKYTITEEKQVIINISNDIKIQKIINDITDKYNDIFKDINTINLSQKINAIKIAKKLDNLKGNSSESNIQLGLYYILKGNIEKKDKYLNEFNSIFSLKNDIEYMDNNKNNCILEIVKNNLVSKFNKLEIKCFIQKNKINDDEDNNSIVFTHKFNDLLDVIHFGYATQTPVLLEGVFGQGKLTAIKYFAYLLNLEILRIPITKSTKVDDLLCKTVLKKDKNGFATLINSKTPLCKAIENKGLYPEQLVILEGINNASPAILEILNSIFGPKDTNILLPNGSTITKGNVNLIGIFNPSNDNSREKLPTSLINNCLYYIVDNPSEDDIKKIIDTLFNNEQILTEEEKKLFTSNYLKAKRISESEINEFPITLNEVKKYIQFRNQIPNLDKSIFMKFIFQHHFTQIDSIKKVQESLKFLDYMFNPYIEYSPNNKKIIFRVYKKGKGNKIVIPIKNPNNIKSEENIKLFNSLTQTEKFCLLFLLCCIKAEKVPIIQGETASGKSYTINILSKIMGEELFTYQMNENTGISIFTGQSIMKEGFSNDETIELEKIIKLIDYENKNIDEINGEDIQKIINIINNLLKNMHINEEEKAKYENAKSLILKMTSPLSRFEHQDSSLIKAIKDGNWILLDGIEHSPSLISEKLSAFCEEEPTLNIYESGFDELNFDISNINENCKLFFIYNPSSQNSQKIDQSLFHKCIKFTLNPIDDKPNDAATILFNGFSKNEEIDDEELKYELSSRITSYHLIQSKKSKQNTDLITGNIPFTSRNLTFISNDYFKTFKNKNIPIESWLKSAFDNYYWRSFIEYSYDNNKKYIDETFQIIRQEPDNKFIINKNIKKEEEFKEIVEDLIGIQNYAAHNIAYNEFDFKNFVEKCYNMVPLNKEKMEWLLNNIDDTLLLLNNNKSINNELKSKFYQIIIIKKLYKAILSKSKKINGFVNEVKLSDEQLLKIDEIKQILLQFKFLNKLLSKNICFYERNINYYLFDPLCSELCKKLDEFVEEQNMESFIQLVSFLFDKEKSFIILELLYPFDNEKINKKKELEFASYYVYLWITLYKNKNNFSLRVDKKEYNIKFKEDQLNKIYCYFIFNEKQSTFLSNGSYIGMIKKGKSKNKNKEHLKKVFIKEVSKEETKKFLIIIKENYDIIHKDKQLLGYDTNFSNVKRFESLNFYFNKLSSLIPRIWPIIYNFDDNNNKYIINYFIKSLHYLESDTIKNLTKIYKNINEEKSIEKIIGKISDIIFFCNSSSIIWKYRYNNENINNNDFENDINLCEMEIEKLNKLKDIWEFDEISEYEEKLNDIHLQLITKKNKDQEDEKVSIVRKKCQDLLNKIKQTFEIFENIDSINNKEIRNNTKKNKKKNKKRKPKNIEETLTPNNDIDLDDKSTYQKIKRQSNYLTEQIIKFMKSEKPTENVYSSLEAKVNDFIEITKKNEIIIEDLMELPFSNHSLKYNNNNMEIKIEEIVLWYSKIKNIIDKMIDGNISDKNFMEYSMQLNDDFELNSITNYINEKKWEINDNNYDKNRIFSYHDKSIINSMLRGAFLYKIDKNSINIEYLSNFIDILNKQINPIVVSEEEYEFGNYIGNKFPFNLKIIFPNFEAKDVIYLFFKYNKNNFDKNNIIIDVKIEDKLINQFVNETLNEIQNKNEYSITELTIKIINYLFRICEIDNDFYFDKNENKNYKDVLKELSGQYQNGSNKKNLIQNMIKYYSFIENIEKIIIQQKTKKFTPSLSDLDLLINEKEHTLMDVSTILNNSKNTKNNTELNISPTLIYYINENKEIMDKLINKINNSNDSILKDLNKSKNYIPFWLYILRKVSSIHCIEIKKDEKNPMRTFIRQEIKQSISKYLSNKKNITPDWINLISINVSNEIMKPTIKEIIIMFGELSKNPNKIITGDKEIKNKVFNILKDVFSQILSLCLDNELEKQINIIPLNSNNTVIEFIKNPSKYIYLKIQKEIINMIEKEIINYNYIENIDNYKNGRKEIINKMEIIIDKINDELMNKYEIINNNENNQELERQTEHIIKLINKFNEKIDKVKNKKNNYKICNIQITSKEYNEINEIYQKIKENKTLLYDIDEKHELIYFRIPFNYNKLKKNDLELFYSNEILLFPEEENIQDIYMIINEISEEFKNNFTIKKGKLSDSSEAPNADFFNMIKHYNGNDLKEILDFEKSEKKIINKLKVSRNKIKIIKESQTNQKKKKNKHKKKKNNNQKNEIDNIPEILFKGLKWEELKKKISELDLLLEEISNNYNLLIYKNEKKINKNVLSLLEEKITSLNNLLKEIDSHLKIDKNHGEEIEKTLKEYYNILIPLLDETIKVKAQLSEIIKQNEKIKGLNENNIFKENYSLPQLPENSENLEKLNIDFSKINYNSEDLCVPMINLNSDSQNLICSQKKINIYLGEICPYNYDKPITIKIISFVKEKIKNSITKSKLLIISKNHKGNSNESEPTFLEEKYLTVIGETLPCQNIELYLKIPKIFDNNIKIESELKIEAPNIKPLNLEINISLKIALTKVILKSNKYELIYEPDIENNIGHYDKCYKLNTNELESGEIIEFVINNYSKNNYINFYASINSLENNTCEKPKIECDNLKGLLQLFLPKYHNYSNDKIPRINCEIIINFNEDFHIIILIDALINVNIISLLMYDYFYNDYVEKSSKLYLNRNTLNILKNENKSINLYFVLYSTFNVKQKLYMKSDKNKYCRDIFIKLENNDI